jgi:2-amino-4-hydroxy-6-hydroxymethyldihydropteridine diphosphokinase
MIGVQVAVALGSNLGDRTAHLDHALSRLRLLVTDVLESSRHETEPVGVGPQPRYLNQVIVGRVSLPPRDLLEALLAVERERGRQRPHAGAPRTLDLDLILYGDRLLNEPGLQVPHPRFRDRRFVLAPLAEIAPELRDPVSGLTVKELLERLPG